MKNRALLRISSTVWATHLAWVVALAAIWIFVLPRVPRDWSDGAGLFSVHTLAQMVLGLTLVQALGGLLGAALGRRASTVLTGILGGFISSTAVTATAARNSRGGPGEVEANVLLLICSAISMLVEAAMIIALGMPSVNHAIYLVFTGPLAVTLFYAWKRAPTVHTEVRDGSATAPDLASIARISIFLVGILTLSKLLARTLGKRGLLAFTLLASFFEIHATLISNTALRSLGEIENGFFAVLAAVSIGASYVAKLFLVRSLGAPPMFRVVGRWVGYSLGALFLSTLLALHFLS